MSDGVKVDYYDPIIPYLDIGQIDLKSIKLNKETIKKYDCVVMAVDHTKINYSLIRNNAKMIFDIKNVYAKYEDKKIVRF